MDNFNIKGSKILLVEDEDSLAQGLEYNLIAEGYAVFRAADGKKALELYETGTFDLVILDIMLPFYDGFEIAEKIRAQSPQIPILMLTARTNAIDRIRGLELGADDYLTKPFNLTEFLIRVQRMLKRKMWYKEITDSQPIYRFGENEINFADFSAIAGKRQVKLTSREAMVLKYLIERKGEIVSRKELLKEVWHIESEEVETRTVDAFIVRLRKYFEPNPAKPQYIVSIRSEGYLFIDE